DDAHRFLVERAELIESEMRGIRLRGERTGNRVLVVMFCIEAHAIESRPTGSAPTAKRAASIADGRGGGGRSAVSPGPWCSWQVLAAYLNGMSTSHIPAPRIRLEPSSPGWVIAVVDGIRLAAT